MTEKLDMNELVGKTIFYTIMATGFIIITVLMLWNVPSAYMFANDYCAQQHQSTQDETSKFVSYNENNKTVTCTIPLEKTKTTKMIFAEKQK